MSLARMLLTESAGVSIDAPVGNEYKVCVEDGAESMFMDAAIESLMVDIYNVDKAYMVADVIAETKVITEGASPEVLLENIITSGLQKLKEAFQKFWKKIKSWFAEIRRQFDIIFLTGKNFIDKFRKELMDKPVKGFKYTGYDYDQTGGNSAVKDAADAVTSYLVRYIGILADVGVDHSKLSAKDISAKMYNYKTDTKELTNGRDRNTYKNTTMGIKQGDSVIPNSSEARESIIEEVMSKMASGADSTSEITKHLTEQYRGGAEEGDTTEIEEFGGNMNKDNMMDFILSFKDAMKTINDDERKFDKHISSIIKKLDSYKSNDVNDQTYKDCRNLSALLTKLLNLAKIPTQVKQSMYKEINSTCHRVLKQFLNYKPAKESVEISNGSYENLLEAAMRLI